MGPIKAASKILDEVVMQDQSNGMPKGQRGGEHGVTRLRRPISAVADSRTPRRRAGDRQAPQTAGPGIGDTIQL